MLQHCSQLCGWAAAILAAICIGSFGVPIKLITKVDVDPLIFQTYKTTISFVTCWLVIPLLGQRITFTELGIASGLFWVVGAMAGIYGIQNAGLALSVGIWCSLNVLTSCFWGVFVFREHVKSLHGMVILVVGFIGMSRYASSTGGTEKNLVDVIQSSKTDSDEENGIECTTRNDDSNIPTETVSKENYAGTKDFSPNGTGTRTTITRRINPPPKETKQLDKDVGNGKKDMDRYKKDKLRGKIHLTRRQRGILGAIVNGTFGGCKYIPMHYARRRDFDGPGFLISYSCGSMLILILVWICRYLYNLARAGGDFSKAYSALPSFHFKHTCIPGLKVGVLYSVGNFCSLIAISALGQGVGGSFIQSSMMVSGLWGIALGEIRGSGRIAKWLASSVITIIGAICLSQEREG